MWLGQIWEELSDLLPQTYKLNGEYCSHHHKPPVVTSHQLSVVWHVRVFDETVDKSNTHVCRSCRPGYISGLDVFVGNVMSHLDGNLTRKDVVVQRQVKHASVQHAPMLQPLKNASHVLSEDLKEVLCTLANADLLVATGSSLPALLVYFLPKDRPVVLEEARLISDAYLFGSKGHEPFPFKHTMPPGRTFHVTNGQPDEGVTPEVVAKALKSANK